jgi:hypothetical protein
MTYDLSKDPNRRRWLKPKDPSPEPVYFMQVYYPNPKATHKIVYWQEAGVLHKKTVRPKKSVCGDGADSAD